jgi:hypothetical protein
MAPPELRKLCFVGHLSARPAELQDDGACRANFGCRDSKTRRDSAFDRTRQVGLFEI